jgi:ABC-type transport system involved in cytochrome bd biosynthesis fused ATPase/permease subunit
VLERAARIVVLEAGRVSAVGSHGELILREGAYRDAWLLQTEREAAPDAGEAAPEEQAGARRRAGPG